jgi:hypothetical protein
MSSLYQAGNITKRSGKTAAKKLGEKHICLSPMGILESVISYK